MLYALCTIISCTTLFAQENSILNGRIIFDDLPATSINIINRTQHKGTINDKNGLFSILATPGDTIVFSAVQYQRKEHIVSQKDVDAALWIVELELSINELETVLLSEHSLSGNLESDIKQIPTFVNNLPLYTASQIKKLKIEWPDDAQSPVENLMLNDNSLTSLTIDLIELMGLFSKKRTQRKTKKRVRNDIFELYSEDFMTRQLQISETSLYDFMAYVRDQKEIDTLYDPLKQLDFLIQCRKSFRALYTTDPE